MKRKGWRFRTHKKDFDSRCFFSLSIILLLNVFWFLNQSMPDKNNTNRGQDVVFLTNTALRSRLRHKVLTRSRALSLPENTASDSQATKSSIFSMIFGKNERSCTLSYYKWVFAKRRGNCDNLARLVLFLSGIHISNNKSQLFCEKNNQKIWHQTVIMLYYILLAVVAEQADAYVWGAYGRPYGFKSHQPHQKKDLYIHCASLFFCKGVKDLNGT